MKTSDNGHITACKISDANPNEMVVSWSGDHIYAFNLIAPDQDVPENTSVSSSGKRKGKVKKSRDGKSKRSDLGSSLESGPAGSKPHRADRSQTAKGADSDIALRVHYENGQSEDFSIESSHEMSDARMSMLNDEQKRSYDI